MLDNTRKSSRDRVGALHGIAARAGRGPKRPGVITKEK